MRLLVLEGVERIEIALRMRLGYSLGRASAFAHEDASTFVSAFTRAQADGKGTQLASRHEMWLQRVRERQNNSDEAFVAHFRFKYDDRMPIWALTEVLELGHVARLYAGLRNDIATEIAVAFGVPTKQLMQSWIATLNYVRNLAAHHARLFNRKLVSAPKRPRGDSVPLLAHLTQREAPKQFGSYSALAVMAYLMESAHPGRDWSVRVATLLRDFPTTNHLTVESLGVAAGWLDEDLWRRRA
ncbi:Abi family protein [Frondihabitans peucedani]|uniref:Abi family protein n=1 Tax=Frondihabitans peucedani TaxID=598626 RepID=A0ABP8E5Q4_9MICO